MLDTAIGQGNSAQNIFPNSVIAFMWLRAPKILAKYANWEETLTPQSVLNAAGCDVAETRLTTFTRDSQWTSEGRVRLVIASPLLHTAA